MPRSAESPNASWRFDNSYARLSGDFYSRVEPAPVKEPRMVLFNTMLAESLGLTPGALHNGEGAAILSGNSLPQGAEPIAQAYAGHQYGHFTMLGDGRAILLGEHLTPDGRRVDIQLKGSGRTPYSRGGDGRAALGPMLREYVISEFMYAMGIPTTRSLAVVTTGESVYRTEQLPGAILTRVAASHIRVGTFEWAAARRERNILESLADHTVRRHYSNAAGLAHPYRAMFRAIMEQQAALLAQWQCCGFIHGVMNTDNMALSGETIDYGPCAFMDTYHPAAVFSSIDHHGRYAYGSQPSIAHWNLARLAEAMLPLFDESETAALEWANEAILSFKELYERRWLAGMRAKLGLPKQTEGDRALAEDLLDIMQRKSADFTNTFRQLIAGHLEGEEYREWLARWQKAVGTAPAARKKARDLMLRANPAVIPRNHKVEEALMSASNCGDLRPLNRLLELITRPFDHTVNAPDYQQPAPANALPYQTFCGT